MRFINDDYLLKEYILTDLLKDPCEGFCDNGGECFASANSATCKCPGGFSGDRCETAVHDGSCPNVEVSLY